MKSNLNNILQVKSLSKKECSSFHLKMSTVQLDLISCGKGLHRSRAAREKAGLPKEFKLKRSLTKRFCTKASEYD